MGDMAKGKVSNAVGTLGDYLKEQRTSAQLSLRQLAEQAGVSNPYLSQIERGLRKPSAEVLQQLARALRISAEQLYIRAGIVSPDDGVGGDGAFFLLLDEPEVYGLPPDPVVTTRDLGSMWRHVGAGALALAGLGAASFLGRRR